MTSRVHDERGTTLVEMVTVMALLAVVLTATFAAIASMQATSMGVDERIENLTETRLVMSTLTQDIRTATRPPDDPDDGSPFVVAGAFELQFYANLRTTDGKPRLVEVAADDTDGILRERVVEPQGDLPYTYDLSTATERFIGGYLDNDLSAPLFTYFDAAGDVIPMPSGVLTDAQRLEIAKVEIDLRVRRDPNPRAPATVVRTTVRLPNLSSNLP